MDYENNATWDIAGYALSDRQLVLVCDYNNGTSIELLVSKYAQHCMINGRKKITVICQQVQYPNLFHLK